MLDWHSCQICYPLEIKLLLLLLQIHILHVFFFRFSSIAIELKVDGKRAPLKTSNVFVVRSAEGSFKMQNVGIYMDMYAFV